MDKQKKIVAMFDDIAKSYDFANRVLSFGSDIIWRKRACQRALAYYKRNDISRITDVACGTGDMLLYWKKAVDRSTCVVAEYLGIDPSKGMLEVARKKLPNFRFEEGYAQDLPIFDESSDFVSITYGIRNVVERMDALKEFYRVLKPGGILVILEFTKREKRSLFDPVVEYYMKNILPKVGGWVSGNREAYEYLPNSIDNFLTTEQLVKELKEVGFSMLEVRSFSFGISTMFLAQK